GSRMYTPQMQKTDLELSLLARLVTSPCGRNVGRASPQNSNLWTKEGWMGAPRRTSREDNPERLQRLRPYGGPTHFRCVWPAPVPSARPKPALGIRSGTVQLQYRY